MKRIYFSKLLIAAALLFGCNVGLFAQTTTTFTYTGAVQTYLVTSTSLSIDMYGASGGNSSTGQRGGYGGRVQCLLSSTPGTIMYIYVMNECIIFIYI